MSARAKGVILLIVGIVLLLISRTLLGANDVNGLLGGLCLGIGGAREVSLLVMLLSKETEMQSDKRSVGILLTYD